MIYMQVEIRISLESLLYVHVTLALKVLRKIMYRFFVLRSFVPTTCVLNVGAPSAKKKHTPVNPGVEL